MGRLKHQLVNDPTNVHRCVFGGTAGEQGYRLFHTAQGRHQRQLGRAPHSAVQPIDPIRRGGWLLRGNSSYAFGCMHALRHTVQDEAELANISRSAYKACSGVHGHPVAMLVHLVASQPLVVRPRVRIYAQSHKLGFSSRPNKRGERLFRARITQQLLLRCK